jgi:hypothetical protein
MKKSHPFHEAKPRTPKAEARQREIDAMKLMEEFFNLDDEEAFRASLAARLGIMPGNPRYELIFATWRDSRRGKP